MCNEIKFIIFYGRSLGLNGQWCELQLILMLMVKPHSWLVKELIFNQHWRLAPYRNFTISVNQTLTLLLFFCSSQAVAMCKYSTYTSYIAWNNLRHRLIIKYQNYKYFLVSMTEPISVRCFLLLQFIGFGI